ncbi:MAG: excinuclease ABC subunit UvrC [Bacilli bacterium]|jgi:excinuclease ABC subunit C|nr:excinuclease ABC subunit UvrC [Bacilli bacterium]MCH4228534.1 excinuclease ABC subunit UvrC [Bacilli bacterium]MCI2055322.1 excinuclease ABC subunit UvrC [Bacilli bacterium]
MELSEKLKRQIALLPDKPGVYQMKDADDRIIYIGKAKNLKKRVSQYFLRPQSGKVLAMVSHVDHFDFIIVHSDKEAFILEMNMIQTHYPRYNIMLMDDSHYPYIALKRDDAFLKITRDNKDRRYFYFGPFPNSGDAYKTIDIINSLYPTRKCRNIPKKACLYYHLGQCLGPCINKIEPAEYQKMYDGIKLFLDGGVDNVRKMLKEKMEAASDEERYEDAGHYKGLLDALEKTISKQSVELNGDKTDRDVFAYAERDGYVSLSILTYRHGLLLGKKVQVVPSFLDAESQVSELIESYYRTNSLPDEILCNVKGFKEEFLSVYPEAKVGTPKEGRLLAMIDMAALNARQGLDSHFMSARLDDDNLALLEELGKLLEIKTPYRIELFDNSHLQGSSPVGAMVCYINGEPAKGMYRKFHLSNEDAGDDYHSMKEVTYRRYSRLKKEGLSYPDLILVDGGLPQVHACEEALKEADVDIAVYGLYKNDKHQTEGIIDKNERTCPLDNKSPLFFLLMRMQDEVHRFAISFHKQERSKAMSKSLFDDVAGIGPKRKETLRKHYPTIESLKNATEEELRQILPEETASLLFQQIKRL